MINKILIGLILICVQLNAVINLNDSRIDKQALFARAIEQGNIDLVKKLIKAGVNVNHERDGWTTMMSAFQATNCKLDIIKTLIKAGANINNFDGWYLRQAITNTDIDLVQLLLNAGINANTGDRYLTSNAEGEQVEFINESVLQVAVESQVLEIIELLINAGANVNLMNGQGNTAICYARSAEVIKLLIDAGADLQIKDINGKTQLDRALETACERGNLEAIEYLQSL